MAPTEPMTIFVAMPGTTLGEHAHWTDIDEIKRDLYLPVADAVAAELGVKVVVQIEKDRESSGPIHYTMFREALEAPVYIADLTGANPNVYLELGVRWALKDYVTVLVSQDVTHDVKFNVAANRVVPYSNVHSKLTEARQKIVNMILNGLKAKTTDSPVRQGSDLLPISRAELEARDEELRQLRHERGDDLFAAAMDTDEPEQRIGLLKRVIAVNPNRADAHGQLGIALSDADQNTEALAALRQATRHQPDFAEWWRRLGVAQSHAKEFDAAADSLQRAVDLDPRDAEAHSNLGGVHRRRARRTGSDLENLRKARNSYQEAAKLDKHNLYPLANLRRLNVQLADDEASRAAAVEEFAKLKALAEFVVGSEP
ncbi:MAG TPA: tetratricopeptide repeat protein, partial [Lentzea sp.]